MSSIRSRLIQVFSLEIIALGVGAAFSLQMHTNAVNKYKSVTDTMVAEYHLTDTASNLSNEFNKLSLSSTSVDQHQEAQQIHRQEDQIRQLYHYLDGSITDPSTRASYEGLKNTINDLVGEINSGVTSLEQGKQDATLHYAKANQLYSFVQVDGNAFLTNELRHITSLQQQIKTATVRNFQITAITYILVTLASLVYAVRMSKVIVRPIAQLTSTAEAISRGNMEIAISPVLLARKDETGRLSKSFNVMLLKLKEIIAELNQEKVSVEQKVIERTQELKDEKVRLEASINSLGIGFIMTNVQDEIIMMNSVAATLLAYTITPEGLSKVDTHTHRWTTEEINAKMGEAFPFKENLAKLHQGITIDRKELDYNGRIFKLFMAPIIDPHTTQQSFLGTVVLVEDITEEKVMARSKDEFFSIASHELRTPLTAIRGNASMIQKFYTKDLKDPSVNEMVDDIREASIRLIDIVNDFLDASKLEQGKMTFTSESFDISEVIESVVYEMSNVVSEKKLYLKVDKTLHTLPHVYADKNRVKQIIYNLLGNALKFTDKGGIGITAQQHGRQLRVIVSDTGRGIPANKQTLLFRKFQQAGKDLLTRDSTRGTGMGLYISKRLVEEMGGKLALDSSTPDQGTSFSFYLPLTPPKTSKSQGPNA